MKSQPIFPKISNKELKRILTPPSGNHKTLRVVLDTDFDNEVDDWFALTWLLLQAKQPSNSLNKINLEAVTVAPYSFKADLDTLVDAYRIYLVPPENRSKKEQKCLDGYVGQIEAVLALGTDPFKLKKDPHLNGSGDLGVSQSYQSVLKLFKLMKEPAKGKVFKGSTKFMKGPYKPVESEAARRLVELGLSASPRDPLYILTIGCPTNVASAILLEPKILPNIVVIWDAGYPTNVQLVNDSLNLKEDLYASQLLFSSGVPLVYIPGFYIAQQLNMSQPDLESWFGKSGKVGKALIKRYMNNPLFTFYGIDPKNLFGRNWIIWDIANIAWLLNPNSLPSALVKAPILTKSKKWKQNPKGHLIREANGLSINAIFPPFVTQLKKYYQGK